MPQVPSTFACPSCNKRFSWAPELAKRKFACPCGRVFEVSRGFESAQLTGSDYAVDIAQDLPRVIKKPSTAFIAAYPQRKSAARNSGAVAEASTSTFRDKILPDVLIALGLVLRGVLVATHVNTPLAKSFISMSIFESIVQLAAMVLGAYAAAAFLQTNFGDLKVAALKLAGIAVFTGSLAAWAATIDRDGPGLRGMVLAIHIVLLMYFAFLYAMFELDLQEALTATLIIGGLQGLVMVAMHLV